MRGGGGNISIIQPGIMYCVFECVNIGHDLDLLLAVS